MKKIILILLLTGCAGEMAASDAVYTSYPFRDLSVQLSRDDFVQPESMPSQIVMSFDSDISAGSIEGRAFPIKDLECQSNSKYKRCLYSTFVSLAIPKRATTSGDRWQYHEFQISHVRSDRVRFRGSEIDVDVYLQSKGDDKKHGVLFVFNKRIGVIAFVYDSGAAYHLESDAGILSGAK